MLRHTFLPSLALLFAVGCSSNEQEERLARTFEHAEGQALAWAVAVDMISRDPAMANIRPPVEPIIVENQLPILVEQPAQPWSVVISHGPGTAELTVTAYGESTTVPVRSKVVRYGSRSGA